MDLQTGRMSRRVYCKLCKMTRLVVQRVEELATKQGFKSLKFLNRKKEPMLLEPIDRLVGIDGRSSEIDGIIENMDEDYGPGADDDEAVDELLVVDSGIDPEEVADLLNDGSSDNPPAPNVPGDAETDPSENRSDLDDDLGDQCDPGGDENASVDAPSLVSEPDARPQRETRQPARYNPSSGRSYVQIKHCHHIFTQTHPDERTLEYSEGEEKVVATILTYLQHHSYGQLFNLGKGLKEFQQEGVVGAKKELGQMNTRRGFRLITVAELTRRKRLRAQEGLMLLT